MSIISMENAVEGSTPLLFEQVGIWLQAAPWKDVRHKQTVAWMLRVVVQPACRAAPMEPVCGLLCVVRAKHPAQRLHNRRISVPHLYAALLKPVLADFQDRQIYLALDKTMLWDTYCVVYLSLIYRGRIIAGS
jgi:hypothetical protein